MLAVPLLSLLIFLPLGGGLLTLACGERVQKAARASRPGRVSLVELALVCRPAVPGRKRGGRQGRLAFPTESASLASRPGHPLLLVPGRGKSAAGAADCSAPGALRAGFLAANRPTGRACITSCCCSCRPGLPGFSLPRTCFLFYLCSGNCSSSPCFSWWACGGTSTRFTPLSSWCCSPWPEACFLLLGILGLYAVHGAARAASYTFSLAALAAAPPAARHADAGFLPP